MRDPDSFYLGAIGVFEYVFTCTVVGYLLVNHLRLNQRVFIRQDIPKALGQIGHFVIGVSSFLVKPGSELFGAKARLS